MCAQCNRISYIYIYILLHPKEVTCQSCLFSQLLFLVSAAAAAAAHSIALLAILLSAHPPVLVLRKGGGKGRSRRSRSWSGSKRDDLYLWIVSCRWPKKKTTSNCDKSRGNGDWKWRMVWVSMGKSSKTFVRGENPDSCHLMSESNKWLRFRLRFAPSSNPGKVCFFFCSFGWANSIRGGSRRGRLNNGVDSQPLRVAVTSGCDVCYSKSDADPEREWK